MSSATVNSPKKRGNKHNPAKWDDEKTRILLEVFEHEIIIGNRPAGVFSKQGWINIVYNFNRKTGLNYNKDQLKNRQDNLRREYTKSEKLIGHETGLGWDHDKQTIDAPDELWEERSKTDPEILRYKEAGPVHLQLLQSVFTGTTATDFYSYIPEDHMDPQSNIGDTIQNNTINLAADDGVDNGETEFVTAANDEPSQVQTPVFSSLRGPKRKRLSNGSSMSASDKLHCSVESIVSTMQKGIDRYNEARGPDDDYLSYKDSLVLLKGLLGMSNTHPLYVKAVRILTDKLNCIAFVHLLEDDIESVYAWLQSF